jgi:hypothetical protein
LYERYTTSGLLKPRPSIVYFAGVSALTLGVSHNFFLLMVSFGVFQISSMLKSISPLKLAISAQFNRSTAGYWIFQRYLMYNPIL